MKRNYMLIDDSKIDLYVTKKIIEKADDISNIKCFSSALSAIDFLRALAASPLAQSLLMPDVIFLDINMPELNGFEFLSKFNELKFNNKKCIDIYILSSSTYLVDIERSKKIQTCKGYIEKPLTLSDFGNIVRIPKYGS